MKTIVEIHALQNFAPSNLNRDDTGAPKDALFGGTRRARVSSQCIKRAVRLYFAKRLDDGIFKPDEIAVRTKRVYEAVADQLDGKRDKEEAKTKARVALSYLKLRASKNDDKTEYLLFLGQRELSGLTNVIDENWEKIVVSAEKSEDKKKAKGKKAVSGEAPKEVRDKLDSVFNGCKAVDVALFGRMLADMPEKNQDAACQVAHAISTHAVEREFDFYTAVDDRKPEDTAGADMMGTVEFNSACFYRYALVDWQKLVENLQNDRDLARNGLRAFLEGFVLAEPTGKQNTFAAHNPPEFVAVSVRRDTEPRNLANAFEAAVRVRSDESLTLKSAEELVNKARKLQDAYGGEQSTLVLDLTGAAVDGLGKPVGKLQELLDGTISAVGE